MEHYFSEKQTSNDKRLSVNVVLKNDSFKIFSSAGLFSKDELDYATKLLIENAEVKGKVLDLGCGYGVVGIALLRKKENLDVTFSDINERAVELTSENLRNLSLKGKVVKSDLFENLNCKFDTILSNPPYAAGRELCFKLIEDSYNNLNSGGTLQIVARHNKGGSVLYEKIKEVFGNGEELAKAGGFRVYAGRKK